MFVLDSCSKLKNLTFSIRFLFVAILRDGVWLQIHSFIGFFMDMNVLL